MGVVKVIFWDRVGWVVMTIFWDRLKFSKIDTIDTIERGGEGYIFGFR